MSPPGDPVLYEGTLQFQFSALVQATALSGEGPWAPAIPWALTYLDNTDQEVFYLANTDLLRQFPMLLDKLRALPDGAAIAQEMLNQGFPCYLYMRRDAGSVHLNVTQYRDGRDALLREDIVFSWDEFVGLLTMAARRFLTELAVNYPPLRRFLNPPIQSFNLWTARWQLIPFQPPADMGHEVPTSPAGASIKAQRKAQFQAPIYLQEWRNHKEANLRLNTVLVALYAILTAVMLLVPLSKVPLGYWVLPIIAILLPWLLVNRYPIIPLNSPLWAERGIRYRVFFHDTVVSVSAVLILATASQHKAEVMWLWLFPLGWLLCLFCGLGFPGTHWARPLWDWSRPMILGSLLLASCSLWLLADLGAEMGGSLRNDRYAPRVIVVATPSQDAVAQWKQPAARKFAQPIAWMIDEYSVKGQVSELLPYPHPARAPIGQVLKWLWIVGVVTYALGLAWAQLPSPTQVRIHSTPVS